MYNWQIKSAINSKADSFVKANNKKVDDQKSFGSSTIVCLFQISLL